MFRLVRAESVDAHQIATPTDAELDELCRAMWAFGWDNGCKCDECNRSRNTEREALRVQMRAFLEKLE